MAGSAEAQGVRLTHTLNGTSGRPQAGVHPEWHTGLPPQLAHTLNGTSGCPQAGTHPEWHTP